jgi:hypothetical protein
MDPLPIGKIIAGDAHRDAIHIAIAPVTAFKSLDPGDDVGLMDVNGEHLAGPCSKPVGIVDPFLQSPVRKGQRFYLFLYPNTVTSLRHEWTHPAFADAAPVTLRRVDNAKQEAEEWLRRFAAELSEPDSRGESSHYDLDRLEEIGRECLTEGSAFVGGDNEQDTFNENRKEFLRNVAIYLGLPPVDDNDVYFSCAC